MTEKVIVIGSIVFAVLLCLSILWLVRRAFVRHDPERALASVPVAANAVYELQLPGSPGELFFRFEINADAESNYDLLVSGQIFDELGGTRAFAVRTSSYSRIEGAKSARYASTTYASAIKSSRGVTISTGSISLATVRTGDRVVRGKVAERPSGLLRKGWVYLPGSR